MVKVEVDNENTTTANGAEEEWVARVVRIGLAVAKRILPRELGAMRYNRTLLTELAEAFAVSADEVDSLPDRLAEPVALGYVRLLAQPPGTSVSLLIGLDDGGMEVKAEMFWRCALRLHMNTLEELESMARRWSPDLELGAQGTPESSAARRKVQLIGIVLPSFAMVCKTQKEIKESEVRKTAIEKMKKEAAEKEAKKTAEREKKGSEDSTVSRPVASTTATTSTTTATTTMPSKPPPSPQPLSRPNEQKGGGSKKDIEATAARHTYDNYSKWDDVDVDLDEIVDYSKPTKSPQPQTGGREKSAEEQALDAELNEKLQDPELRKHMMDVLGGQFTR
jgi:hypothetical protein